MGLSWGKATRTGKLKRQWNLPPKKFWGASIDLWIVPDMTYQIRQRSSYVSRYLQIIYQALSILFAVFKFSGFQIPIISRDIIRPANEIETKLQCSRHKCASKCFLRAASHGGFFCRCSSRAAFHSLGRWLQSMARLIVLCLLLAPWRQWRFPRLCTAERKDFSSNQHQIITGILLFPFSI